MAGIDRLYPLLLLFAALRISHSLAIGDTDENVNNVKVERSPDICQDISQNEIKGSIERTLQENLIPIQQIPNTSLSTGVFYFIYLSKFPHGFISWTNHSSETANYTYVISTSDIHPYYSPKWMWMIAPTEDPGSYFLINRAAPDGFFTWTEEDSNLGHFIQLSRFPDHQKHYQLNGKWRKDAFVLINSTEVPNYYQLHLKTFPTKIITWTYTHSSEENTFLQVDTTDDMNFYLPDGKFYNDTLFRFTPVMNAKKIFGEISELSYKIDNLKIRTRQIKMFPMENFTISNDGSVPFEFSLRYNETMKSLFTIQLNSNLTNFQNVTGKINLPFSSNENCDVGFGGLQSSFSQNVVPQEILLDEVLRVPPRKTIFANWYLNWVDDGKLEFTAQMKIRGFQDRMSVNREVVSDSKMTRKELKDFVTENNLGNAFDTTDENEIRVPVSGIFEGSFPWSDSFRSMTKPINH